MIKILKYLRIREVCLMIATVLFVALQVFLELKLPDYMSEITILVKTPGSPIEEIWRAGFWMLLCALGGLVVSIMVGFFSAKIAANFSKRLRTLVYDRVTAFSMEEINGFSTASLITRSTNDIVQVQMMIVMGTSIMFRAPIMATWAISKIYAKSWQWTFSTGVAIVLLISMIVTLIIFALPKFRSIQGLTDNLNRVTRENLTGIRVVRAYNAEKFQQGKFEQANEELTETHLYVQRAMAILGPGMTLIMSGLSLAIYWIGAYLINQAQMPGDKIVLFSDMVVFSSYAMQVVMSFMMLTMIFIILPRAAVSARRILEVLDTKPTILDGAESEGVNGAVGEVEFRNVSFKYPDAGEYVLNDITFKAKKGETVAFIGSTGSGKSTLVHLVERFFDASEGEVLVDGRNVKDYTQAGLHNKIGFVPQRAVLFGGTIDSNIAYGEKDEDSLFTKEAIEEAIRISQSQEFVEKMDKGMEADVSQGGTNLSGGQKQRVSIARAICRKPEIFIFDDSFSALDYKTDRVLRGELKKATKDATTLLVAQRIGTIIDADKIVVLDEGRIVGMGTHRELLKECEVYRQIAYSQLSKEELE